MADPFAVTAGERTKHEEQFKSLGPNSGFLTGDQAKRFFLMSKLPPQVLGVIWSFSDVDGDGKLSLHEFSIACKLINLKLRGVNLPATLPVSLRQTACGGSAATSPPGQPGLVSAPMQQQPVGMMMGGMAGMNQPGQPMMQGMGQQGMMASQPAMAQPMMAGMMQPMAQPTAQQSAQPVAQVVPTAMQGGGVGGVAQIPSVPVGQVAPQAATAVAASPVGAAVQRRPSDGGFADWAVPQHSKLKYTQVFNMTDRTKSGFLSGVQARNILIQAQLPQQILAQIWALSDCDGDGRLSCEEFVLALYLCEQAKQGVKPPTTLPPDLIPPSQRRQRGGSVTSVGSGGGQVQQSPVSGIVTGMMVNDDSFEDKRKENFDKGQAELERRRKALLEAQRRETEERLRREREEEAKREKIRQEAEKRRQEELEKEMRRQQEVEMQKEEERKRQQDMKEQAQKDAERQRQLEWEKQRLQELMNVRQRQQENLLALKAKNQSLGIEMETKEDRVKELTQKISETRIGVTEVKATIDGMRTTRDNYMSDMNQLKASARDQNQRLLALNQEKARLKARSTAAAGSAGAESAVVDATLQNKQMVIKQLQEKADELETEVKSKEEDLNNNLKDVENLKSDMMMTADRCKELYTEFDAKRKKVLNLREKLVNPDAAWGDSGGTTWAGKGFGESTVSGSGGWTSTAWPPTDSAWTSSSTTSHTSSEIPSTAAAADPSSASLHPQEEPVPAPHQQKQQPPGRPPPVRPSPPSKVGSNSSSPLPATALGNGSVVTEAAAVNPKEVWAQDSQDTADTWGDQANTSSFTTTTTTALWGASPPNSTSTIQTSTTTTSNTHTDQQSAEGAALGDVAAVEGGRRFRALYQFDARNADELSFMPGDIITVTLAEGAEPGWLGGTFQGATGWFPEAYCEPCDGAEPVAAVAAVEEVTRTQLEQIPEEVADSNAVIQKNLGEALGIFPWRAKQNNHLSFNKGDRIVVKEQQDQWWYGEAAGAGGWFPHSYVRMVSGPGAVSSPATTPLEAPEEPPMPDTLINDEVSEYYMALYPYESSEEGDLTFEAGAVILVVKKEGDWWHGITDQRSGVFPSNYVQKCPAQVQQETTAEAIVNNVAAEESQVSITGENVEGKGKKPEIATVIAPYDATSNNQLNLSRGQLIMIRKKTPSGWWEGELQARGKKRQIGWFPASYVKVLGGSSRSTPTSMELTNREDAPPPDLETPGSQSGDKVINTSAIENSINNSGNENKTNGGMSAVEALYPYTAMNDDELNFEAGAIITVLDKEDEAWWKGTLNGVTGMFPSNYVAPIGPGGVSLANATGTPDGENFDSLCYQNLDNGFDREDITDKYNCNISNNRQDINRVCSNNNRKVSWQFAPYSPIEQKRQAVIQEIIATESSYLSEMILVQKAFIQPMKSCGAVSQKELDLIFVNWDELINANSYFNKALKIRCQNSSGEGITMIADVLCQQIAQLTPYLRFCSLQLKGSSLLGEKLGNGGAWCDIVRQCQEQPAVQGHTLTSFLLKPMQRITKYPLLMKQLLKYTPEGHPDFANTQEALTAAELLCGQVNEAVSQRDNTDKLEWMQSHVQCEGLPERLVFNSLTNTLGPRKLLHTGVLHKAKSRKELVAFLLSDFLLLTTPSKSVSSCTTLAALERHLSDNKCTMYRKPMFLSDLEEEADRDSELCLTLKTPQSGDVHLSAPTANERNNWLKKIAMAKNHLTDTERSLLQRTQSKENDVSIVGRVLVTVMGGVNLSERGADGASLQSFCEVSLGSQVHRTSISSSPHPKWDSTMQFLVKALNQDVLCITVYEKGCFKPNDFLGRTEIRIWQVAEEAKNQPGPQLHKMKLQEVQSGEVILKISLQLFDRALEL